MRTIEILRLPWHRAKLTIAPEVIRRLLLVHSFPGFLAQGEEQNEKAIIDSDGGLPDVLSAMMARPSSLDKNNRIWMVSSPELLSAIDGRHVKVKAHLDAVL